MRKILGLCGLAGAGKDTVASFFMERGWIRVGFADALYRELAEAFDVSVAFLSNRSTKEQPLEKLALINCRNGGFIEVFMRNLIGNQEDNLVISDDLIKEMKKSRSPRELLQHWGTEFRRVHFGDDYWRAQVSKLFRDYPNENFIITDVRFPDEANLIIDNGGSMARVIRPELKTLTTSTAHSSENAMKAFPTHFELVNKEGTAGLAQLRDQIVSLLEENEAVAA